MVGLWLSPMGDLLGSNMSKSERFQTLCVHRGVAKDSAWNSVITPIYATSTFRFTAPMQHAGYDYSRTANPTRAALEECLAALEGGARCTATATGMAAEMTVMAMFPAGSHIIAGHDIYGGTYRLFSQVLAKNGLEFSFVDMTGDPMNVKKALRKNTRAVWIETPTNPLLNLVDIAAVCGIAKKAGVTTIVDNTFMSPFFQHPLELGADVVMHSTTKYINGHSDVVSGAIISKTAEHGEKIAWMMNNLGTGCSPFDAWLVLRGVKTLPLRMKAHNANALALAHDLEKRPEVSHVYYPGLETHPQHALAKKQMSGFGGMLSFDLKGGQPAAFKFVKALKVISFAESLGGVESLIEHPETMSHASMTLEQRRNAGIADGNLRVSVGIENAEDLIEDLDRGFAALKRSRK